MQEDSKYAKDEKYTKAWKNIQKVVKVWALRLPKKIYEIELS